MAEHELAVPDPQHATSFHRCESSGVSDSQLAVLLRQTQWALDDAAYYAGGAGLTRQQRDELAGTLDALAEIIRASLP